MKVYNKFRYTAINLNGKEMPSVKAALASKLQ